MLLFTSCLDPRMMGAIEARRLRRTRFAPRVCEDGVQCGRPAGARKQNDDENAFLVSPRAADQFGEKHLTKVALTFSKYFPNSPREVKSRI